MFHFQKVAQVYYLGKVSMFLCVCKMFFLLTGVHKNIKVKRVFPQL